MILTGVVFYTVILNAFLVFYFVHANRKLGVEEIEYSFSGEGMRWSGKGQEGFADWAHIRRVQETRVSFEITPKTGNFLLVPKLAFTDLEDLFELKELFKEKLGTEAYLRSAGKNSGLK